MKIHWKDEFKADYKLFKIELKKSTSLRKALLNAVGLLQQGKDLSEIHTVNRIPAHGQGWYACYFHDNFVLIYKIQGQYVKLSRIGTAKQLGKGK